MTELLGGLRDPVLVVGGYGYRNLGDEAILAGLLARLAGREVTVVSRAPAETSRLHGTRAIGIAAALPALARHRTVIIGGGGLFGADMGLIGRLLPAFGLVAAALRRRVVIAGVGLDAESVRFGAFVPQLMRRAAAVGVRDRRSVEILASWGVRAVLEPDLSTWMPMRTGDEAGRAVLRDAGVRPDRPVVGLALTGLRPELAGAVVDAVSATMDAFPDVEFCFVPMSRHPRIAAHDDLRLARRLALARPRLRVLARPMHPADALAAFGQLTAVVAMRYHAMLFAERASVPLVPIPYAEKTARWLAERRLEAVPPDATELSAAIRSALAAREAPAAAPARPEAAVHASPPVARRARSAPPARPPAPRPARTSPGNVSP